MAKHIYLTNKEGGYFYRFYPKIRKVRSKIWDDYDYDLFNPPEDGSHDNVSRCIYGKFVDKYNDKHQIIELLAKAEFVLTDLFTSQQERRILTSRILIHATDEMYNWPFQKDKIYALTVNQIIEL